MGTICGVRKQDEKGVDFDPRIRLSTAGSKTRIYNGESATQKEFPFQCQLYKSQKNDTFPFCSASILSPLYLLTAGHCLVENSQTLATVYALVESETYGRIPSRKIVVHENYYELKGQSSFLLDDIGLVFLSEPVLFNEKYRPICISGSPIWSHHVDQDLILAGYGSDKGNDKLKQATFNFIDTHDCEYQHSLNFWTQQEIIFNNKTTIENVWNNKFCAAATSSSQRIASCSGDSGAPLMIEQTEFILGKLTVKYNLVGIVSSVSGDCSNEQLATIFTDVFGYSDWIASKINETEYRMAGRYCSIDNDKQCVSCDYGYHLTAWLQQWVKNGQKQQGLSGRFLYPKYRSYLKLRLALISTY